MAKYITGWQGASRKYPNAPRQNIQMKRHGNLWQKLTSRENMSAALHNACLGKCSRAYVKKFMLNPDANLERIRQDLIHHRFHTGRYNEKEIFEPKRRLIYMLPFNPDRIVQHALLLVLIPIYEPTFIRDSYASIDNRGMHAGSRRTMEFMRKNNYCLKCDIRKFYPNIDHDVILKIIGRKIKDKNIMWLINDIVRSFPGGKNLPIGNYFSQWGGNIYLNELDQFVKHTLRCKHYVRYCDDFVLFSNDKRQLAQWRDKMRDFLRDKLKLEYSKAEIFPVKNGVDFLGYRHFRRGKKTFILVRKRTAKRIIKSVRQIKKLYAAGRISVENALSKIGSYYGWIQYANSFHLKLHTKITGFMRYLQHEHRKKIF